MMRARLSAMTLSTVSPGALDFHGDAADLEIDLFLRPPTEQEDDHTSEDTEDAEHHQPEPDGINTLDGPAILESDRAIGLLGHPVRLRDEIQAVIGDEQPVRQREEQAAEQLDPRLAPYPERLRERIDPGMRVDRIAVAHPQRKDGGVEMPLQLLELRERYRQAGLACEDVERRHHRHDDEEPARGERDLFQHPPNALGHLQKRVHGDEVTRPGWIGRRSR